jgi:hypothetical protein
MIDRTAAIFESGSNKFLKQKTAEFLNSILKFSVVFKKIGFGENPFHGTLSTVISTCLFLKSSVI